MARSSVPKTVLLLLVLAASSLSGCAGTPKAAPSVDPGPSLITRAPGILLPPIPANPGNRTYELERCTGLHSTMDLPEDWVQPAVRQGFEPLSLAPGTAGVAVRILDCPRVSIPGRVLEAYHELLVAAAVRPRNASWTPDGGVSFATFDLVSDNPTMIEELGALGIPMGRGTFARTQVAPSIVQWAITGPAQSFEVTYTLGASDSHPQPFRVHYWTDRDVLLKTDVTLNVTDQAYSGAGTLHVAGTGTTASVVRSTTWEFSGNAISRLDESRLLNSTIYRS